VSTSSFPGGRARPRSASNELYDRACDLLAAAQGLAVAADAPGTAPATAAALGCLEAALALLGDAVEGMRDDAIARLASGSLLLNGRTGTVADVDARRDFDRLTTGLHDAARRTARLRERIGPAIADLSGME